MLGITTFSVLLNFSSFFLAYVQFLLYIRHAPSQNKFWVGIHSEYTVASCGTYAKRAKNEAGVNPLPNAHYALYVQAPKCIIEPSV